MTAEAQAPIIFLINTQTRGKVTVDGINPVAGSGPLEGVTVIELGQLIAGPFAGQLLGDFGAEVIKVELPGTGDPMRSWGHVLPAEVDSLWWSVIARNKKSVTADIRVPEGRELLIRMVSFADVLIENFRPGTMEKWGLSYEVLRSVNPRLVMVRVSGFGQTGPYSERAGFGAIGEAMGGLRALVGDPDRPPVRTGIALGDAMAGALGAFGVLAALYERNESGEGQVLDVALYESVLTFMESLVIAYHIGGWVRERTGATLPGVAPSNVYPTADAKEILIAANQDSVFRRLAEAMLAPELSDDLRYATHLARGQHQVEIDSLISAWTITLTSAALLEILAKSGVPAGPIYQAPEMLEDPHFAARSAIIAVPHPAFGMVKMQNVAPKASRTPGSVRWVGPRLGAHNEEILTRRLGLSLEEFQKAQGDAPA